MVVSSLQKYKAVCRQTHKYLYVHKAYKHQSYKMGASQGATYHPVHSSSISRTLRRQENRTAFSCYGDSFRGHPTPIRKIFLVPPRAVRGRKKKKKKSTCLFYPLSLFIYYQIRATTDTILRVVIILIILQPGLQLLSCLQEKCFVLDWAANKSRL